uniref:Uncharacterized protein n=1 Tax=Ditylenchus dipsaci TaxID=166011 RepID=A0A915D0D8_9BILA
MALKRLLTCQLAFAAFLGVSLAQGTIETTNTFQYEYLWALIVAFHLSFVFAFAMGANEVSNAFATSVSSGAISLRWAYVLATMVESAGGILLVGYKVLETLRFKVIDLSMYENNQNSFCGASCCTRR